MASGRLSVVYLGYLPKDAADLNNLAASLGLSLLGGATFLFNVGLLIARRLA